MSGPTDESDLRKGFLVGLNGLALLFAALILAGITRPSVSDGFIATIDVLVVGWFPSPGISPLELLAYFGLLIAIGGPIWYWIVGPHTDINRVAELIPGQDTSEGHLFGQDAKDSRPQETAGHWQPSGTTISFQTKWRPDEPRWISKLFGKEKSAEGTTEKDFHHGLAGSSPLPDAESSRSSLRSDSHTDEDLTSEDQPGQAPKQQWRPPETERPSSVGDSPSQSLDSEPSQGLSPKPGAPAPEPNAGASDASSPNGTSRLQSPEDIGNVLADSRAAIETVRSRLDHSKTGSDAGSAIGELNPDTETPKGPVESLATDEGPDLQETVQELRSKQVDVDTLFDDRLKDS